jgi:outer membrane protein W
VSTAIVSNRQRGNSWEFPMLGKYYFGKTESTLRPFLGTGYSFREIWYNQETTFSVLSGAPLNLIASPSKSSFRSPLDVGAVFAAGVRAKAGRLAVLPEFRYVRWGGAATTQRKNEVKFLLGVSF